MGFPAARVTDLVVCPMATPTPIPVPHVAGLVMPPCSVNVLTGGLPQARSPADMALCAVQPPPVPFVKGSATVFVNSMMAVRAVADPTAHGGMVAVGFPTVLIGG
jgi:uncharacterized Zn-binding protein involved in type VI secretion